MIVCPPTQNLQRAEALARICFRAPNVHAICTCEVISTWVSLHKVARHLIQTQSVLYQPTPPFCVQRKPWSRLGQTPLIPSMKSATLGSPLFSTDTESGRSVDSDSGLGQHVFTELSAQVTMIYT